LILGFAFSLNCVLLVPVFALLGPLMRLGAFLVIARVEWSGRFELLIRRVAISGEICAFTPPEVASGADTSPLSAPAVSFPGVLSCIGAW